jgi:large subunit ribosomal protein L10
MSPKKVNPQKAAVVARLKDLVGRSKAIAVVDYKGLKVNQATDLRRAIRQAGGQVVVTKNTLFSLALKANDQRLETNLEGPSAFVFSLTDEISAIRALADFAKKNTLPTFKLGFLGDQTLSATEISQLAVIPDRTTNYQLLTTNLKSPLYGLVYSLNWNLSKLVRTLDAVRASKTN